MRNPTIDEEGNKHWYNNQKHFHREDGPAVISSRGGISWYIDGSRYYNNKTFQLAANLSDEDMLAMILKYGNVK
jgi:hypothetical protein